MHITSEQLNTILSAFTRSERDQLRQALSTYDTEPRDLERGDWVLYKGKPRQVVKFLPYSDPVDTTRDRRFDWVHVTGLKGHIYANQVRPMILDVSPVA